MTLIDINQNGYEAGIHLFYNDIMKIAQQAKEENLENMFSLITEICGDYDTEWFVADSLTSIKYQFDRTDVSSMNIVFKNASTAMHFYLRFN